MNLPSAFVVGQRYEIIRFLSEGGMAELYLAKSLQVLRELVVGDLVVVKVIKAQVLQSAEARQRFLREMETGLALKHPNIVKGIECVDSPEVLAYVMEYVDGGDLKTLLSAKPNWQLSIQILCDVLKGLSAVHALGLVHRDLKPENILISKNGHVKIGDFGTARFLASSSITQEGMMMGTPLYIAPEYIETGESDNRGDIFAWGVMAYELLAGQSPFHAPTKEALLLERFKPIKPMCSVDNALPSWLGEVVHKALSIRLTERYQNVEEILQFISGYRKEL